jgi:hypothetical protein
MAEWFLLGKHDLNENGGKTRKTWLSSIFATFLTHAPSVLIRG